MPRKVNKTTPKPSMLATQRAKVKATKLEAGPATVKGGQAPGAGRTSPSTRSGQGSGRGSAPGMVNRNKPTMRKLAAKAAQSRKAGTGRPLVRKAELDKANKPSIKEGAKKLRVPGDSGQVRAAQARGKAEVAKAQARRGAKAASKRMEGVLKAAGAARAVVGGLKTLGRGGIAAAVMAPRPAGDATLSAAMKRGDYKPKQGPSPKTTQSSFNKKTFDQAFSSARKAGAKTFTWRGKKYTTKMKGE